MAITVTLNDEQIRAAVLNRDWQGKVDSLELESSNQSPYGTLIFKAAGIASAQRSLIPADIMTSVRFYLRDLKFNLQMDCSVNFTYEEGKGFTAQVTVDGMPPEEKNAD